MSNLSQFAGLKPAKVTTYTSGSGTFTLQTSTTWLRLTLLGGGGGGAAVPNAYGPWGQGGQAAKPVYVWLQKGAASYSYAVGAGGAAGDKASTLSGGDGGNSTFSTFTAYGGKGSVGVSMSTTVRDINGESSGYGQGGTVGSPPTAGSGYGAGGGSTYTANVNGGAGSGGLIIVEEY